MSSIKTFFYIIFQANSGDSRAVASVRGRPVALSLDHKPTLAAEKKRIEAAGGWVEFGRVNRHLALSRAFGDFMFKQNNRKIQEEQIVTGIIRNSKPTFKNINYSYKMCHNF